MAQALGSLRSQPQVLAAYSRTAPLWDRGRVTELQAALLRFKVTIHPPHCCSAALAVLRVTVIRDLNTAAIQGNLTFIEPGVQEALVGQPTASGAASSASSQPQQAQPDADKPVATVAEEELTPSSSAAAEAQTSAASPTGPPQLLPPPFPGHTAAENDEPAAAAAVNRDPSDGAKHTEGNVQISTEADALRAQAATQQQHGGFAAARAFRDRLLGAPLRDPSELVRSGLFSLVSTVARAPGSVLGRTASSAGGAASPKPSNAQSPTAKVGLTPAAAASKATDVFGAPITRPGSGTAAAAVEPTAGPGKVPASSKGPSMRSPAIEVTVSATANADRPVRIAISVSPVAEEGPASGSAPAAGSSAAPQAAEAYRPAARIGLGGWLGRGSGGWAPPSPPSALPAAINKPHSPPAAPVQRQPSLPSASARIGSFFRRGGPGAAPASEPKVGEVSQPSATQALNDVAATDKASSEGQAVSQAAANIPAQKAPSTPASPAATEAPAKAPPAERSAVSTNTFPVVSGAAASPVPAASPSRGKLEPDERRKLRVALQMAAQLRQVTPYVVLPKHHELTVLLRAVLLLSWWTAATVGTGRAHTELMTTSLRHGASSLPSVH